VSQALSVLQKEQHAPDQSATRTDTGRRRLVSLAQLVSTARTKALRSLSCASPAPTVLPGVGSLSNATQVTTASLAQVSRLSAPLVSTAKVVKKKCTSANSAPIAKLNLPSRHPVLVELMALETLTTLMLSLLVTLVEEASILYRMMTLHQSSDAKTALLATFARAELAKKSL